MDKDQRLLEEAYQTIYESLNEPLYFGPPKRKQEFLDWLSKLKHEIHSDGSVSIDEFFVVLDGLKLDVLPFWFKEVTGHFVCGNNNLTTLKGAPEKIDGGFNCHNNKLTSLEGSPRDVGNFNCDNNKLTSLKGGPKRVYQTFSCTYNQLTSLEGAPKIVEESFDCEHNKIISLTGAPERIGGQFRCDTFTKEDYKKFVKERKIDRKLNKQLSKDFDVSALEDFG